MSDCIPQPLVDQVTDDHEALVVEVLVVNLSKAGPSVSGGVGPGALIF
ncbi:hypothetical protein [Pirellula sp. SH-Sr6A]|nr:hypothetical protein [Pirellula sp. SH-Sr6A]